MIPGYGPDCDLCTPSVHYLIQCPCGHEWDEPPCPRAFTCAKCGAGILVTDEDSEAWKRDVLGI